MSECASESEYDLVVIGAGPGGEVGAIRAAQLGKKVALVEKSPHLGGTCLNVGCIPTKSLLQSAKVYDKLKAARKDGFEMGSITFNWAAIMEKKGRVVNQMRNGLIFLMKKNGVKIYHGFGRLAGSHQVEVRYPDGSSEVLKAKNILLAMGSQVRELAAVVPNGKNILTSDELLSIDHVPESMAIIGGGVVGMEFASLFGRMGAKVTVLEYTSSILPYEDEESSKELSRYLKRQNIKVETSAEVVAVEDRGDHCTLTVRNQAPREFAIVLSCAGRVPMSKNVGLENAGIMVNDNGYITTDDHYRTAAENIYAIGDLIMTPALAHTAGAEALHAAEHMSGHNPPCIDYSANPSAIYTWPEIASIGKTEKQLKDSNCSYKVAKFPFSALAKASIEEATMGFVKILFDPEVRGILGVHIVGSMATELISEFALAKVLGARIDDIARTIHPHPTLSEAIMEAAHAGLGGAIHV